MLMLMMDGSIWQWQICHTSLQVYHTNMDVLVLKKESVLEDHCEASKSGCAHQLVAFQLINLQKYGKKAALCYIAHQFEGLGLV